MGFTFINKLPTPAEIREQFPLAPELAEIKHARDEEIKRVFTGCLLYTSDAADE